MAESFAIDVGGTFTDLVVLDESTGTIGTAKVPTTPANPATGVMQAVEKAALRLSSAERFLHGTTLGLNTLLENKGAKVGIITTSGFRDVLEIGRMLWPMYQMHWQQPAPLVPRYLRRDVKERVRADGHVLRPLDEEEVRLAVRDFVEQGVEAVAVCFLHSYVFPDHEQRVGEIIAKEFPALAVTLSHEVTREYREYERTSTTAADALIKKRLNDYISNLATDLREGGFRGSFLLTRCDGGVMSASEARRRPIRTLISGPASGVMGAVAVAQALRLENLIAIDMGGTSFDAALVVNNNPRLRSSVRVENLPLLVPVVDLVSIGAGGGSIAWIDTGGALNVGPESASADPGPMCYGRGGSRPTFTDAALVSGLLNETNFLAGELALDVQAAERGIREQIAEPLGIGLEDAASGIVAVTEAKMGDTLEELTIGRGFDPREFALLSYGGGGSLVAVVLAKRLAIPKIVVPPEPGTFSAWGMLTLDIVHDFARTFVAELAEVSDETWQQQFAELETDAISALEAEEVTRERRALIYSADMRYEGQEHTLNVIVTKTALVEESSSVLRAEFDRAHKIEYGYEMEDPVEITTLRIRAVGQLPKPKPRPGVEKGRNAAGAHKGIRRVVHRASGGGSDWAVYDRDLLAPGNHLVGPAIIEEAAATTLVPESYEALVEQEGYLVITPCREATQ